MILDVFGAARVDAFDLDPRMVALAQRRLSSRGPKVRLWVGDVTAISAPDAVYDAVFDFGIIHHVPNWRDALAEVHRVLKPGGLLFAEEPVGGLLNHPLMHRLFAHPVEDRFEAADFRDALRTAGFLASERRASLAHDVLVRGGQAGICLTLRFSGGPGLTLLEAARPLGRLP